MDVSVIVAASTTSTRDTLECTTIGALADAVAQTHAVAGDVFSLKVNGLTLSRDADTSTLTADDVLELIEIPSDSAPPTATPDDAPPAETAPPEAGAVDAVSTED